VAQSEADPAEQVHNFFSHACTCGSLCRPVQAGWIGGALVSRIDREGHSARQFPECAGLCRI